jgi:type IV pilus assembly protein PilC
MGMSDILVRNIHWFILISIGGVFFLAALYRTRPGRFRIDQLVISLLIFGQIVTKVIRTRFFQTLATLLKSGVDIVASLEISGKVVNNLPAEEIINSIRFKIMEGSNMSTEMANFAFFPKMSVRMTAIGEKSGKIDEVLVKVAEYYSSEVDATVEGFSSIIEPLLIVMLGGVVGVFVISMYLPVFKMAMAMMGAQ